MAQGWFAERLRFTTQDITRCQTTARAVALVYNWWSWYCRAAHPGPFDGIIRSAIRQVKHRKCRNFKPDSNLTVSKRGRTIKARSYACTGPSGPVGYLEGAT